MLFIVIFGPLARAESELEKAFKSREWGYYVNALRYYHSQYPNVFTPLELIRIDRLPVEALLLEIKKYGPAWEALSKGRLRDEVVEAQVQVSREANQSLEKLVNASPEKAAGKLRGSFQALLTHIPSADRIAMTPLDKAFESSVLGEKIKKEISQKKELVPLAFTLNEAKNRIDFEGLPPAWTAREIPPKRFYSLEYGPTDNPEVLRFRGSYPGSSDRAGPDIMARKTLFRGSLFDAKDFSRMPFGRIPKGGELWIDEGGASHFSGDGHNHQH